MTLLFSTGTPANANKTTVGDSNFEEHYPQIATDTAWATLQPFIRQATKLFIIPAIGQEMYDAAAIAYDGGIMDTEQAEFVERLQDALAHYTMYLALPKLNTAIGDLGVGQKTDGEGTFQRTTQWAYKSTMWDLIQTADRFLDDAVAYADEQVAASNTWFDDYESSTAWTGKYVYFRTAADLQQYIDIRNSRRTYLALMTYCQAAIDKYIIPILGQDQHDELASEIAASDLSSENETLLGKVKRSLAYFILAEALPHLRVVLENDGVRVISRTDFYDMSDPAKDGAYADLIRRAMENGKLYRAELNKFLYANYEDYPTWAAEKRLTDTTRTTPLTGQDTTGAIFL